MKNILFVVLTLFFFSCGNEKVLLLPEISHSEITDIKDVSHAYLFYDETKTDRVELNRKNLISTTNWLINVDRRLTLKQAIPHIKYLQDKKVNSSHKNEKAKNYFTCNDTSKKNLGFVEFTDVVYHFESEYKYFKEKNRPSLISVIDIVALDEIHLNLVEEGHDQNASPFSLSSLNKKLRELNNEFELYTYIYFNSNINFQDYISIKSELSKLDWKHIKISNQEFLYN
ncbi:hypothetical protein [Flaviramulus aquimarinus]